MTYLGTVRGGKVGLAPDIHLPERTVVRIEPLPSDEDPAYGLAEEAVSTGIPDLAAQHDHYLYGTPNQARGHSVIVIGDRREE